MRFRPLNHSGVYREHFGEFLLFAISADFQLLKVVGRRQQ